MTLESYAVSPFDLTIVVQKQETAMQNLDPSYSFLAVCTTFLVAVPRPKMQLLIYLTMRVSCVV
jgi:hypothetical protein